MDLFSTLRALEERLPELEWSVSTLPSSSFAASLPRGLFRLASIAAPSAYVDEIKEDLQQLAKKREGRVAYYLAEQIQRKINVLVNICRLEPAKNRSHAPLLQRLSTRQNALNSVELEINRLEIQKEALLRTLSQTLATDRLLMLKQELGDLEKQITLAKEILNQMIN